MPDTKSGIEYRDRIRKMLTDMGIENHVPKENASLIIAERGGRTVRIQCRYQEEGGTAYTHLSHDRGKIDRKKIHVIFLSGPGFAKQRESIQVITDLLDDGLAFIVSDETDLRDVLSSAPVFTRLLTGSSSP